LAPRAKQAKNIDVSVQYNCGRATGILVGAGYSSGRGRTNRKEVAKVYAARPHAVTMPASHRYPQQKGWIEKTIKFVCLGLLPMKYEITCSQM
jgi:hypothetical protein